jgi:Pyridoxamine 5'-phosphate oxidase
MHICIYRRYIINSWIQSEQVAKLFKDKNFAYLAMLVKDGSPQVTPVWVDIDNDDDNKNHIIVNTAERRVNQKNAARDPSAWQF